MYGMKGGHSIRESFNYAIEGILDALKTERNMRIHAFASFIVILFSIIFGVTRFEMMFLSIAISSVWMAELFNTALENSIDIVCKAYHPLAKKAKDVAAGAVLISSVNALVIGYFVFSEKLLRKMKFTFDIFKGSYHHTIVMILAIIVVVVFLVKSFYEKGTPLQGGMPSGHSAIAASLWMTIAFFTDSIQVFFLSMVLMFLVIQSRIEGKIHSLKETLVGTILGGSITYLILMLLGL